MSEKVDTECTALVAVGSNSGNPLISCIKSVDNIQHALTTDLKRGLEQIVEIIKALSERINGKEIEKSKAVKEVYKHVYSVCNAACDFISKVEEFYRMNMQNEQEIEAMITEASNKKCEKMHEVLGQLLCHLKQIQNKYDTKFLPKCKTAEEVIERANNDCTKNKTKAENETFNKTLAGGTGGVISGAGVGTGIALVAASTVAAPVVIGGALIGGFVGIVTGSWLGYQTTDKKKVEEKIKGYEDLGHGILLLEGEMDKVKHAFENLTSALEDLKDGGTISILVGITSKELNELKSLERLSTVITRLEKQVVEGKLRYNFEKAIRAFFEMINEQATKTLPTVKQKIIEVKLSLQAIHELVYNPGAQGLQPKAKSK